MKLILSGTVLIAAFYDLRVRRIPNWLNLSAIILGLGLNTYLQSGRGARMAFLGLLLALAVYTPLYAVRGMGAGDVKLMAAVGAISGPSNWLTIFIATALLGGVVSVVLIVLRKRYHQTLVNISTIVSALFNCRAPVLTNPDLDIRSKSALKLPHGAIIAAGVCLYLLSDLKSL